MVTPIEIPVLDRLPDGSVANTDFMMYVTRLEDIARLHILDLETLAKERERLAKKYKGQDNTEIAEEKPSN